MPIIAQDAEEIGCDGIGCDGIGNLIIKNKLMCPLSCFKKIEFDF